MIGRTIAGKFTIESLIGNGAMGAVYRARQVALDKTIAIKVMHRERANEPILVARFRREAHAASRLDHLHSIRVIDFGQEPDGLLYIAMEYFPGQPLSTIVSKQAPPPAEVIAEILSQSLSAIAQAHAFGIIHRDLKPDNILVLTGTDDEGRPKPVVKVCDFGIAQILEGRADASSSPKRRLTTEGIVLGTPYYMSPEQARGNALDVRSDIYSMGVILYELLTGSVPFDGETAFDVAVKHFAQEPKPPTLLMPSADPRLEAVCLKAMCKSPDDRYASAREMRVDVRNALAPLDARSNAGDTSGPSLPSDGAVAGALGSSPRVDRRTVETQHDAPRESSDDHLTVSSTEAGLGDGSAGVAATLEAPMAKLLAGSYPKPPPSPKRRNRAANETAHTASRSVSAPKTRIRWVGTVGALAVAVGGGAAAWSMHRTSNPPALVPAPLIAPASVETALVPEIEPAAAARPAATAPEPPRPEPSETATLRGKTAARGRRSSETKNKGASLRDTAPTTESTTEPQAEPTTAEPTREAPDPTPTAQGARAVTTTPASPVSAAGAVLPPPAPAMPASFDPSRARVDWSIGSTGGGPTAAMFRRGIARISSEWNVCYRDALRRAGRAFEGSGMIHVSTDDEGNIVHANLDGFSLEGLGPCINAVTRARVDGVDTGSAWADVKVDFRGDGSE